MSVLCAQAGSCLVRDVNDGSSDVVDSQASKQVKFECQFDAYLYFKD